MSKVETTHLVPAGDVERLLRPRQGLVVEQADGDRHFVLASGPFREYERWVRVADDGATGGDVVVTETIAYRLALPVWGFLFAPAVRRALRRGDADRRSWWMPPDHLDARAATVLSLLCAFSVLGGYLGTLLSQTNTFFKEEFGSTDGQIGSMLAIVRVGAVLALAVVAVADRRGRRWVLLASAVTGCIVTATGAAAPTLALLGLSQTLARAFATALILVISIMAVEEMPAGSRAFAISLLTASAALGAGLCVMMLAIAGLGTAAWRVLFALPLLAVPVVIHLGRRLPETRRFTRTAAPHTSWWRLPAGIDRGRLALLAASGLAFSLFAVPASAFLNEYLRTERHFATTTIIVFQLATNTPGGLGIVIGGSSPTAGAGA